MLSRLWHLFCRAGWAPFSVLVIHQIVGYADWRENSDGLLHFLGGLSIAFFLYHAIAFAQDRLGKLSVTAHLTLTFTGACTVALFWELGEFASDLFRGTHIQHTIRETMMDLVRGTLGASVTVTALILRLAIKRKEIRA